MNADCVLLAPSNPVVSIGAILAVPAIRAAIKQTPAPVVGVSPLIQGRAVRGMAEQCLASIGVANDAAAVAQHYGSRRSDGLLDGWLVDEQDSELCSALSDSGIWAAALPLLMTDEGSAAAVAAASLQLADRVR